MEQHLRLKPAQQALTPAQEAEALHFAALRIQSQLSTEPVDEQEAARLLQQTYTVTRLPPPKHIHWFDGPLQLLAALAPLSLRESVLDSAWGSIEASVEASVDASLRASVGNNLRERLQEIVGTSFRTIMEARARNRLRVNVQDSVWASVGESIWRSIWEVLGEHVGESVWDGVKASVRAYEEAAWLVYYHFFDVYLAPNDGHALARFNELVSGYWLGTEHAFLVRRPKVLSRDVLGRLHSATGKCLEFHDGWGFYAWHGVRVPERVILTPERLSREDFLNERNLEVRRVMQERMGQRFVPELRGRVLNTGPHGTLYEVALPGDPERVARYVQVQDASTERQYVLRVPPTIQTAAEAVAWSFGLSVEAYHPAQET